MGIKSVRTRAQLKDLLFERLGLQFRRVIITEEQIDIVLDTALQKFFEEGDFGTEERFYKLDIVEGTQDYDLPYEIVAIKDIIEANNLMDFFSVERTVVDAVAMQRPMQVSMVDVHLARQYMQDLRKTFQKETTYDFNSVSKRLHLFEMPKYSKVIVLHVYRSLNEEDTSLDFGNIYGHPWIKDYCYALAMIQIGENLAMYGDTPLPNNMKVNYQVFLDRGDKLKEKLDVDLIEKYSAPFTLIMG